MKELPPQAFRRYFDDPSRVGTLAAATGRARAENGGCGDVTEVALLVEGDRVALVRFRCFGCSSAVASASAACELAEGRSLAQVRAIDAAAIEEALGGLSSLRRHGAELALEALRAALQDHASRNRAAPSEVSR